jgi:hypothetical protein
MNAEYPIRPRAGDTILLDDGRELIVDKLERRYNCRRSTTEERRYGCFWVYGADDEEYVVTADVSGLRERTFRPCSNSR